jgi:uncharacterized protein (TIGR02001 family)
MTRIETLIPHLAATAFASLIAGASLAQTAPAKAEPDYTITGNVGLFSQYVFRGISQTNEKPAIQGGFDFAHKSGIYLGTWASNISWVSDAVPAVSSSIEWDFYGGYKGSLPNDFGYDLGVLYYYYPGSYPTGFSPKPNTTELYAALSWKFVTLKYSYAVSDTFGFPNSDGSYYVELNASYDVAEKVSDAIGKVTIYGHVGYQDYKNNGAYSYTDWKVGGAAEIVGLTWGIYVSGTDGESALYTNRFGKDTAGTQVVGYVQKTF